MLIEPLSVQACIDVLERSSLGRLACALNGQPYIIPITFAYHPRSLYSFSTVGQKIAWMRMNPFVCVEVDEIVDRENWATVLVFGRYEELPNTSNSGAESGPRPRSRPSLAADEREFAHRLLQKKTPIWWEPGYAKTIVAGKERPMEIVYFRIQIEEMTGRRGFLEERQSVHGAR